MGTINYGNGNIINIGYKNKRTKADNIKCNFMFDDIANSLDSFVDMEYYSIKIKSGYYEGFYIDIARAVYFLDNADERAAMVEEWAKIYTALNAIIAENGLRVYGACGWAGCSWYDKRGSLRELEKTNKAERAAIAQYKLDLDFSSLEERLQYINRCKL